MKISGHELLRNISMFFSQSEFEAEVLLMLILPISAVLIFVFYFNSKNSSTSSFAAIPAKDMEIIDTVRLQKGLEGFDRDFLIELALTYNAQPGHILIDPEVFARVENSFRLQLMEKGETPETNTRFKHLLKLKSKIFTNL